MSTLVAVASCQRDLQRGLHNGMGKRGLNIPGVDVRFFLGGDAAPDNLLPDEVFLSVPDDYQNLPLKVWAMLRWALDHGYDFVLKCDNDASFNSTELTALLSLDFDWAGDFTNSYAVCVDHNFARHAPGGAYILSHKAIELVLQVEPRPGGEDHRVSEALHPHAGVIIALDTSSRRAWLYKAKGMSSLGINAGVIHSYDTATGLGFIGVGSIHIPFSIHDWYASAVNTFPAPGVHVRFDFGPPSNSRAINVSPVEG